MAETEKTPLELAEQFVSVVSLVGSAELHEEEVEVGGKMVKMDVLDNQSIHLASEIREKVEDLLGQSKVTEGYKTYIRNNLEMRFTSFGVRFAETLWFRGSAFPILQECGIALDYQVWSGEISIKKLEKGMFHGRMIEGGTLYERVPAPPQLGIFEPDVENLKVLERDILRFALEEWGWGRESEEMVRLEAWAAEFSTVYGEEPPITHQGEYEHPVIRELWRRSQPA